MSNCGFMRSHQLFEGVYECNCGLIIWSGIPRQSEFFWMLTVWKVFLVHLTQLRNRSTSGIWTVELVKQFHHEYSQYITTGRNQIQPIAHYASI